VAGADHGGHERARAHRSGFSSFDAGKITECNGAPGETWHCKVKGSKVPVSIFACVCCDDDGTSGHNWQGPHWSAGKP
jgi:hypothetical protein